MDPFGFDLVRIEWLRGKPGGKWHKSPGLLAAWVADMDFPAPPVVVDALQRIVDSRDLGYPSYAPGPSPARTTFVDRSAVRYGWRVEASDCIELNDVIQGVQAVLHLCTGAGDGVVMHVPAYPPFLHTAHDNHRRVVPVRSFDVEALRAAVVDSGAKVVLLCHPHNPTGHVFGEAELRGIAALADELDLLLIADEIHADLTYAPAIHQPVALFAPDRTVTLHAASKAFNLAGLRYAVMHVGPPWLRDRLDALPNHLLGSVNVFGAEAARVVWADGDEWLAAVVAHLDGQRMLLGELLAEHLPDVRYTPPAATYLAWLDCRASGFGDDPSQTFLRRGVRLSEGPNFGDEGLGHVRLNFATSSAMLRDIVVGMARVV